MVDPRRLASVQADSDVGQRLDLKPQTGSSSSNTQESTIVSTQTNPSQASAISLPTPTALPVASHPAFTFLTNSLPLSVPDHDSVTVVVQFPPTTPIVSSILPSTASTSSTNPVAPTTPPIVSTTPDLLPIASSSATDVTSLISSMSGAVPVTSTALISSAAVSLAPVPRPSSSSFFQNKAESGAVLGVVSLVALTGISFIAYRFYKSVKERRADRETEYAARDAANVKVRLDDDDDMYGTPAKGRGNVLPFFNRPTVIPLDFSTDGNMGAGIFDGNRPSPKGTNTYLKNGAGTYEVSLPLHHQPHVPPPYFPPLFDPTVHPSQTLGLRQPSIEPTDNLIPTRLESIVPSEVVSQTVPSQAPAQQQSPLPTLSLPEAFGEGEPGRRRDPALTKSMGDDEDYSGAIRRVLKIANE